MIINPKSGYNASKRKMPLMAKISGRVHGNHKKLLFEFILYNELAVRGYSVDVGMVECRHLDKNGKDTRSQLEVDFIAKRNHTQLYIQSALNIDTAEKREQETASLLKASNSFKEIKSLKQNQKGFWGYVVVDRSEMSQDDYSVFGGDEKE